jgi:hypothetical protein
MLLQVQLLMTIQLTWRQLRHIINLRTGDTGGHIIRRHANDRHAKIALFQMTSLHETARRANTTQHDLNREKLPVLPIFQPPLRATTTRSRLGMNNRFSARNLTPEAFLTLSKKT